MLRSGNVSRGTINSCIRDSLGLMWVGDRLFGQPPDKTGVTDTYSYFAALITAIGSDDTTLVIPKGTYRINSDLTFPANIHVIFRKGAKLKPMTVAGSGTATNADVAATGTLTVAGSSTTFTRSSTATAIYEGVSYLIANPGSGNERKLITDINPESPLGGQIASAFSGALSGAAYSVSSGTVNTSAAHGLMVNDVVVIDSVEYYVVECPTTTSFTIHKHPAATFSAVSYTRGVRVIINNCEMVRYQVVDTSGGGVVQFVRGIDQMVSPEMWGAVGDGATGNGTVNATAINRALRCGSWISSYYAARMKVDLAAGVYCLNDSIWLSPGPWVDGAGKSYDFYGGTKLFMNNGVNKSVFMDCPYPTGLSGRAAKISNLTIQTGTQTLPTHGVSIQHLTGTELENLAAYAFNFTDYDFGFKPRVQVRGKMVDFWNCGNGINLTTDSFWCQGEGTFRRGGGIVATGGDCSLSHYKVHAESHETGKTPKGLLIYGGAYPTIGFSTFDNIGSSGTAGYGAYFARNDLGGGTASVRLIGCSFRLCKNDGIYFSSSAVAGNLLMQGLTLDGNAGYGLNVANGAYLNGGVIDGLNVYNNTLGDFNFAGYISLSTGYRYPSITNVRSRISTDVEFVGDLEIVTVSGTMAREDLVGLNSSSQVVAADAYESGPVRIPAVGIIWVGQSAGAGRQALMATRGRITNTGWSALTVGGEAGALWTSTTAGDWTQTKPTTATYLQQNIGHAIGAKEIQFSFPAAYSVAA